MITHLRIIIQKGQPRWLPHSSDLKLAHLSTVYCRQQYPLGISWMYRRVDKWINSLNMTTWYVAGGIIAILITLQRETTTWLFIKLIYLVEGKMECNLWAWNLCFYFTQVKLNNMLIFTCFNGKIAMVNQMNMLLERPSYIFIFILSRPGLMILLG